MGKMGQEKMGNLSHFSPTSPDFLPVSQQFPTFFSTFPTMYFWQFLTIPHFPPFPPFYPISPHFATFFHLSDFSKPLRLGG